MSFDNFRFCKKCLTRDMLDKDTYFKTIKELIENLPEDARASSDIYELRLSVCTDCDRLTDGMCSACGCYVELRAAKVFNKCPYDKW